MNKTSDRLSTLSPEKRKLYELLQAQRAAAHEDMNQLKKSTSVKQSQLSFMQEQICFLESMNPGSSSYNIPVATEFKGTLNREALTQAIQIVIQRHEVFKTSFSFQNGQWCPKINDPTAISFGLENFIGSTIEDVINVTVFNELKKPFHLEAPPLIRVNLYKLSEQSHVLLIVMHHLISDGWSFGVFLREVMECYNAFVERRAPQLNEVKFGMSDFANWQHHRRDNKDWNKQIEYWKTQLIGIEPLALPTDFLRPAKPSGNGARINFEISQSIASKIVSIGQIEGITPFMFFLTAFQIFLYRYSNQELFAVGTPAANREIQGCEEIIGPLINTIALRSDFTGNLTLREALVKTRNVVLEGLTNQNCPFELVVQAVNPVRDPSRPPLIQTLFSHQISPTFGLELNGLTVLPLNLNSGTSKVDLELDILQESTRIQASLEYSSDIFSQATVAQMAQNFLCLVEGMTKDLNIPVADLPIIPEAERQKILHKFNETFQNYPEEQCIVRRFEAHAKAKPESKATIYNEEFYTYRDLEHRASAFAGYLRENGVQPGHFVGYFGERCKDLMVAILGILKAGAVYVPIDPTLPSQRLEFIIADCKFLTVVTQKKFTQSIVGLIENILIVDDEAWLQTNPLPPFNLDNEDIAYIIYTSGTTGQPKGALIHHGGLRNRLSWMQAEYSLLPEDKVMQKTPLTFDVSIWELFWPLMTGATMVIAEPNGHMNPEYLYSTIGRNQISIMHFVPSMLQLFLELSEKKPMPSLRQVFASGEALPYELKERFFKRFSNVKLHNLYGPTEASIDVTYWDCSQQDFDERRIIPIGYPIANTQIYILDRRLRPVPNGTPGELFIGGLGVAKGYLNRPDLSAERFISSPFISEKILYRTGDLARFLHNGAIEYLGRMDFQVKIRGLRIELGEIDAALLGFDGIRECVTTAEIDNLGAKHLVSYFTLETGFALNSSELIAYLGQKLPSYMIPVRYIVLEKIPLSANGKVDRKALPKTDVNSLKADFVPPSTELEHLLADIWKKALGVSQVSVFDNIFSIGGDSIRTLRIAGLAQAQGVDLTVAQILQHQNISALAKSIESNLGIETSRELTSSFFELINEDTRKLLPADIEDAYPLSQLQTGMIFHLILDSTASIYQNVDSIQIEGPLNITAFQKTLEYLIERHPILRTSFDFTSFSEPLQLVHKTTSAVVEVNDWTGFTPAEQEKLIEQLTETEKHRHFSLAKPPLMRFLIHILSKNTFQLTIPHHHAILDGWSISALCVEMCHVYQKILANQNVMASPLKASFRDFIKAERKSLESEQTRNFWLQSIIDVPPTNIAADLSHADIDFSSEEINFIVPGPLIDQLIALAAMLQKSVKTILLTAHCIALAKITGEKQILTGLNSFGRIEEQEGDQVLGLFLNTVPLRVNLNDATWMQLIDVVHQAELHLYPHRRFPMAEIQRLNKGQPPITTLFNFTNFHIIEELDGNESLKVSNQRSFARTNFPFVASFDLTLGQKQKLNLNLSFDSRCYTIAKMEFVRQVYLENIHAMLKDLTQEVQFSHTPTYQTLTSSERERILTTFRGPQVPHLKGSLVHKSFEKQVEKSPDAIAVIFENQQLTYRELNNAANRLAHHLQKLGVGPEALVGIYLERSLEMIICLFAVLKAGGGYVPIDPSYPADRVSHTIKDSKARVVLTQERLLDILPSCETIVLCADRDLNEWESLSNLNPISPVSDENIAYIIYTSGSTGTPKGVMIQHDSFASIMKEWGVIHQLKEEDRILQFFSISFDAAVAEIFSSLMYGARIIIRSDNDSLVPSRLHQQFIEAGITKCFLPTAYWHHFIGEMEALSLPMPPTLKILTIGGEAAQPNKVNTWQKLWGSTTMLMNIYGPTETAVIVTQFKFYRDSVVPKGPVPIGRPLNNVQIYILDSHGQPTPIGVPGEIHIGGVQVARGYFNQPQLTAEKFVKDQFGKLENGRLYKTGDLAAWLPDGNIQYLGRIDFQVKIRGFRIELGEIESHLANHPQVAESVVIARKDREGNSQLIAYVVCKLRNQTEAKELRSHLANTLPDFMIPSAIIILESLPLNINGKLDRKALPLPEEVSNNEPYVAPRTITEQTLAEIAANVLSVNRVSMTDSFFSLNGNSLLAIQLLLQIRRRLNVELPLKTLFSSLNFAEIAIKIDSLHIDKFSSLHTNISRIDKTKPMLASYAQERLWFLNKLETQDSENASTTYIVPMVWRLNGPLSAECLEQALKSLVNRHESFRTAFQVENSQLFQVITDQSGFKLEILECTNIETEKRDTFLKNKISDIIKNGFDLQTPPLIKAVLFKLTEREHILLIYLHHIISDGWSNSIMFNELCILYTSYLNGTDASLPTLSVQYTDYSAWQRSSEQQIIFSEQLGYWKKQLSNAPTLLALPMDRPRPVNQTFSGAFQPFSLNWELSKALKELSQERNVTLFMTLAASFALLLSRHANQTDLVFGTPIANRVRSEFENIIGLFVNTIVLRFKLNADLTFIDLLAQTKQTCLDAYSNQTIPFEYLVAELNPKRSLAHSPLFQVMLTLQNFPKAELSLPGINITEEQGVADVAKFDLTLILNDSDGLLKGGFEYNIDLFDQLTMIRLADHFHLLIENIISNPNQSVSTYPMLTTAEFRQLVSEFNKSHIQCPKEPCVHHSFERQVKQSPNAIAVVFENQQLTYDVLNNSANRLAHHLQQLGVGPEILVGIYLERGLEMIICLLAIIKAGGAYVPIDPSYPAERVSYMLTDSKVKVLLTQERLLSILPPSETVVTCVDRDQKMWESLSNSNPISLVHEMNLAYVIYTSGSTGKPKGVMIQHNSFARVLAEWVMIHQLQPEDRYFQFSSISFDVAGGEIFSILISGAQLVIRSDSHSLVPSALRQTLIEAGITKAFMPTAYWHQFTSELASMSLPMPPKLKMLTIIGEAAQPNKVKIWLKHWGKTTLLINAYGPTETAVIATEFKFLPDYILPEGPVSIGQPLQNVPIYILDAHGQPTPIGVAGEIHIGGVQVGRGYLNRPELTAEKFINDPFGKRENGRLYKTGDLATWLADGTIQYLGRMDFQVKVRGFRIELGEIETHLAKHPYVAEAVVIAHIDQEGNSQLFAYVVSKFKSQIESKVLRRYLGSSLPEYMIPAAFIFLESLPLNTNGKLDRKALPLPEVVPNENSYVAPQTQTEHILAEITAKILGVNSVCMSANFFELGGHSLLATKLIEQCQRAFGQQITMRTIFEFPILADFANQIAKRRGKSLVASSNLIPLSFREHKPLLICIHGAEGMPFPFRKLAKMLDDDFRTFAFQAPGTIGEELPFHTITEFSNNYMSEIENLVGNESFVLLGYSGGGVIAQNIAVEMEKSGKRPSILILIDSLAPEALKLNSTDSFITSMGQALSSYFSENENKDVWLQILRKSLSEAFQGGYKSNNLDHKGVLTILEELSRLNALSDYDTINRLARVYITSLLAISQFRPKIYEGEVILFKARGTVLTREISEDYGWASFFSNSMRIFEVDADHHTILQGTGCELIGDVLKNPLLYNR